MCVVFIRSVVSDFVTPWTPLSMGYPGKNIGVGCHLLLRGIFPSQGSNPRLLLLLHWEVDSLPLVLPTKSLLHFSNFEVLFLNAKKKSHFPFIESHTLKFRRFLNLGGKNV